MRRIVLLSLLACSFVHAETPPASPGRAFLHHYDKDTDDKVSLDEYLFPSTQQFNSIDTDKDGYLSEEEASAYVLTMHAKMLTNKQKGPQTKE